MLVLWWFIEEKEIKLCNLRVFYKYKIMLENFMEANKQFSQQPNQEQLYYQYK